MHRSRLSVVVVASDFWDDGLEGALSALGAAGHPLTLLHLLAREEVEPKLRGRVRIVDSESGASVSRFVEAEELELYRRHLEQHAHRWRAWAGQREASYVRCASDTPFDEVCLVYLRGEGVLE